jgi:hypothetical protein
LICILKKIILVLEKELESGRFGDRGFREEGGAGIWKEILMTLDQQGWHGDVESSRFRGESAVTLQLQI